MFLQIQLDKVVNALVEQELIKKGGDSKKALYFKFYLKLDYNHLLDENTLNVFSSRILHLLYYLYPGTRYVDVFAGTSMISNQSAKDVIWQHECNHDSEWKHINIFNDIYFKMASEINDQLNDQGIESVAPIKMNQWNNFLFNKCFSWLNVEITKDKEVKIID